MSITEDPPSMQAASSSPKPQTETRRKNGANGFSFLKFFKKNKNGSENLREALEDYIDEMSEDEEDASVAHHERTLITNILNMRDLTVTDVMIPRADIVAVDIETPHDALLALLSEKQFSRIPVYKDGPDDIVGTVHIKDLVSHLATQKNIEIKSMLRDVPIVSPAMPVMDLMLDMRQKKKHMAMVVDEYGGIDGLVTIGDVLEAIVGEIDDEFDNDDAPQMIEKDDGTIFADARVDIDDFEDRYGQVLSDEDREDSDTLGGLVFSIAGRVPARGEVLKHNSGVVFEVLDADPRRINRLRIKNLPKAVNE